MSTTNESSTSAFSSSNEAYLFSLESRAMEKFYLLSDKLPAAGALSLIAMILNLVQTTLLGFNHTFNFGSITKQISKYFGFISRQWIFDETNYTTFQVVMGVTLTILLISLFYFIYFVSQDDFNWSSTFEHLTATLSFVISHILFVPLLGIFLTAFECDYDDSKLWTYKNIDCYLFPNDISLAFCSLGISMLIAISYFPQIL